jgi:hypothetical protein
MTSKAKPAPREEGARNTYNVTPEQFVETWEASDSLQEVADRLKMPKAIAAARAAQVRSAGVRLKKMVRKDRSRGLNVAGLNEIVAKVRLSLGARPPADEPAQGALTYADVERACENACERALKRIFAQAGVRF